MLWDVGEEVIERVLDLAKPADIIHWINIEEDMDLYCRYLATMAINIDRITELYAKKQSIPKGVYLVMLRELRTSWSHIIVHVENIMKELTKQLWNNALKFSHVREKGFEAIIVDVIVKGIPSRSIHIAYPDVYTCRKAEWIFAMKTP